MSLRLLFEQQEQRFSRFRPTSLLPRLNSGEDVEDALFTRAVRMALEAHEFTGGLFNVLGGGDARRRRDVDHCQASLAHRLGRRRAHLIDPRRGLPAESPFVQVTAWGT